MYKKPRRTRIPREAIGASIIAGNCLYKVLQGPFIACLLALVYYGRHAADDDAGRDMWCKIKDAASKNMQSAQ